MAVTQPRQGRSIVRGLVATAFMLAAITSGEAQEGNEFATIRGQSPSPYFDWFAPVSLPAESIPFRTVPSPWIMASQEMASPQVAQVPADPFGQPQPYGVPMGGDPGLGGAFIDTPAIWQPYVAAQGNFGNKNNQGIGQLMMPLYQDGQSLLFADIRGRWDDQSNTEGNFGLALRKLVDPNWFFGVYGFYDYRRTQYGNTFNQGTLGIEAMSVRYEARLNGYLPESGAKVANGASTAQFDSGTIFVRGGLERAYYGVDGEIGALLWEEAAGNIEFRGFVGGYYFNTQGNGFPSIAGPKGRLEFRLYDCPWFGPESRLTLGVEVQNDNVRDFQIAGIARLDIPLGFFNPSRRLTRLERRMLDRIVRDNDIITVTGQGPREIGIDPLTNRPLTNIKLADALHDPSLATVANTEPTFKTIVVDGGQGHYAVNNPADSIALKEGQVFRGGGFVVVGSQTGATAEFGTRPTIVNNTTTVDTIFLNSALTPVTPASHTTVADLNLVGGRTGVFSDGVLQGVTISGNQIAGADFAGVQVNTLDASSVIENNTVTGTGRGAVPNTEGRGFRFDGTFSGMAKNNTATNNANNGFGVLGTLAGTLEGNTATLNDRFGIGMDGIANTGALIGNVTNNNLQGGISISPGPVAGTISGNTASNNGRNAAGTIVTATADGFSFSGAISANISHNTAINNADRGFEFNGNLASGGKVVGNTASNNFNQGFAFLSTVDPGSMVSGNRAIGNGNDATGAVHANVDGFAFLDAVSIAVSDNQSNGNTGNGFLFSNLAATAQVNGNSAVNNTHNGFVFSNGLASNTNAVSGNTATGNSGAGFLFGAAVAGTVDQNTATGNTGGYGFDFSGATLSSTARVTGNTAEYNKNGFGFSSSSFGSVVNGNTSAFNGVSSQGNIFNAAANGFEWSGTNFGTISNNFALSNANNGFSGTGDNNLINNAVFGNFSGNVSNNNGDKGYRVTNPSPTPPNPANTGSGNVNGGDTP